MQLIEEVLLTQHTGEIAAEAFSAFNHNHAESLLSRRKGNETFALGGCQQVVEQDSPKGDTIDSFSSQEISLVAFRHPVAVRRIH